MARPPGPDTLQGHLAMVAYARAWERDLRPLGFPPMSAFMKMRSNGTVSLGIQPEDPVIDWTHRFLLELGKGSVRALVLSRAYDPTLKSEHERIRSLCNYNRFQNVKKQALRDLSMYLRGLRDAGVLST